MRNLPSAKISIAEKLLQEAVRFLSPWAAGEKLFRRRGKKGKRRGNEANLSEFPIRQIK